MSTIGQYEIRELLGEGGIGQVHVGFDTVLEREVAIKSLRPELLNDKNFIARFRGEAKSLALLNHPNITTLYSLLDDGAKLSMVMELVRGDTLDTLLKKRNGALGVAECLAIIAQAADGLSYAHSMGVIHRDIKPANLMITQSGLLKIMDFGIARVRGSQRLTRDGSMVGTLAYMAPEQLRGEPGDERSDLYSLAIVLYEMLSGATPFAAQSDYELMQMHISARPQRLVGRLPDLDGRVDTALMRALAKKPEQRFASVRAFSEALGAAALHVDASKIVAEGTRLIGRPATEAAAVKSGISGRFDQVSAAADRLHWLPVEWRTPAVVGIATLVVAGGLAAGAFTLMPSPVPTSAPAPVRSAQSEQRPPAPLSVAVAPITAPESIGPIRVPESVAPITVPEPIAEPIPSLAAAPVPPPPTVAPASPSIASVPGSSAKTDIAVALARKDYAGVLELSRPLAESGDRDAQFRVAFLLDTGQGVQRDDRQAAAWYRKAADQGHILAQYNLGRTYENGRGVEQSNTQAFNWFRKAADQGDAEAQNRVGTMYVLGQGTRKDEFEGVSWYEKAAKQGLAKALTGLGNMYASGQGVAKRDDREAFRLYREAAEQKYAEAENNVGWWYEHGLGGVAELRGGRRMV